MASGDVVFETTGTKQDSFSAVDSSSPNGVDVEFSFSASGTYGTTAVLNGTTINVKDVTFKLHQDIPTFQPPSKVEPDSPFDAGKNYKIQIVEV